ncbi:hypothetical protein [Kamptonema formosum]|uniref:hypothetical protein n=1 Tax=Kamptonema formosum TaxID=331992 RepID=UPI0003458CCD|nr:hypothetical protein [Oscillatoria sp. PCC 10802]
MEIAELRQSQASLGARSGELREGQAMLDQILAGPQEQNAEFRRTANAGLERIDRQASGTVRWSLSGGSRRTQGLRQTFYSESGAFRGLYRLITEKMRQSIAELTNNYLSKLGAGAAQATHSLATGTPTQLASAAAPTFALR